MFLSIPELIFIIIIIIIIIFIFWGEGIHEKNSMAHSILWCIEVIHYKCNFKMLLSNGEIVFGQ